MNDAFYFVDLPGYGYAKVPEETKAKWGRMIEKYLNTSKMLKAVFLLIDMRHEPSGNDVQMYDWIVSCGFSPIVLLTKADKLSKNEQAKNLALIRKKLRVRESTVVIPVSAEKKTGIEEVLQTIEGLLTTEEAE